MDKITYLAELAEGLARWVPERERQDILRYYAEYFEEAGFEREAEVIAELGDPWALSCRLAVEGGYVTQEAANNWTPRQNKRKVWPWVLVGTLAAVAIVAVSVGFFASQVGRVIGRMVPGYNVAAVVEDPRAEALPGVEFSDNGITYTEDAEINGGFWSRSDGWLEGFESIDVNISLGNVMVTEGEDYTLHIGQNGNLGGYTLQWEVKNGTLKIKDGGSAGHVESLDDLRRMFNLDGSAMDVVITVPDTAALAKIDVKTDLGNVYLANVYAGKAEAKTDMGNVECYNLRVEKKLELKTDMGNVFMSVDELWDGADIKLETSMGNVEASLECLEKDCAYKLETDFGNVSVNGRDCGTKASSTGDMPYKLDAESSMGDVDVYFQED